MSACQQCLVSLVKIGEDPERYECSGCERVFDRYGRPEGSPDFGKSPDPVVSRENRPPSVPAKPPIEESSVAESPSNAPKFHLVRTPRGIIKVGPRPLVEYFP